ncbi:hypothetical protein Y900_005645 [Mycolicibacterium aromaticivorans JS19b1 = JCM 16368]|uniref:DUF6285 domain-containing protein n=1 Tax=Mycolicibacterium aromaticivorans JS19b1 = JCM 16368 TaxID=1440774 RepID=A0A064CDL9_9MYCO|nr:DUF6285 domain-containing protein [Mycolicibacterium aromaticivorans]KDE98435.1 hypothetical protein Y900_005645 [Mycolicibacterium aromaticivorans JS19b1 = JCM 16368]
MTGLNGRPTAAELVAAVAEFLANDVRSNTTGSVNFHALVAVNVLRTVERELLDQTAAEPQAALEGLGYHDEAALAAAIRAGDLDGRGDEVMKCLRAVVKHRVAIAHPGYDSPEGGSPS